MNGLSGKRSAAGRKLSKGLCFTVIRLEIEIFHTGISSRQNNGAAIMRDKKEPIEVKCPKCDRTEIIYLPTEEFPKCPDCKVEMVIKELLDEGKSY